jgi:hypothetical protein
MHEPLSVHWRTQWWTWTVEFLHSNKFGIHINDEQTARAVPTSLRNSREDFRSRKVL